MELAPVIFECYEGESNENLKSAIKICNTSRLYVS